MIIFYGMARNKDKIFPEKRFCTEIRLIIPSKWLYFVPSAGFVICSHTRTKTATCFLFGKKQLHLTSFATKEKNKMKTNKKSASFCVFRICFCRFYRSERELREPEMKISRTLYSTFLLCSRSRSLVSAKRNTNKRAFVKWRTTTTTATTKKNRNTQILLVKLALARTRHRFVYNFDRFTKL